MPRRQGWRKGRVPSLAKVNSSRDGQLGPSAHGMEAGPHSIVGDGAPVQGRNHREVGEHDPLAPPETPPQAEQQGPGPRRVRLRLPPVHDPARRRHRVRLPDERQPGLELRDPRRLARRGRGRQQHRRRLRDPQEDRGRHQRAVRAEQHHQRPDLLGRRDDRRHDRRQRQHLRPQHHIDDLVHASAAPRSPCRIRRPRTATRKRTAATSSTGRAARAATPASTRSASRSPTNTSGTRRSRACSASPARAGRSSSPTPWKWSRSCEPLPPGQPAATSADPAMASAARAWSSSRSSCRSSCCSSWACSSSASSSPTT